jgi:hypothetical protein
MNSGIFRFSSALVLAGALSGQTQTNTVVVRPIEIQDVLVNPGMGIQTFQRYNGDAINAGTRWSEVGPTGRLKSPAAKPDFPDTSIAYFRWFWSQIETEQGKYRWDILDLALEECRKHGQQLDFRLMPYDESHPLPEWYRNSGARRANKPGDKDGNIWSPDSDDPLYAKYWGALVAAAGARYDGHPYLDAVDISTIGYWGEGWGPYVPSWETQKKLLDQHFDAFKRTPLLVNFDVLEALRYATQRGAGWRLDCWGDIGRFFDPFMHMLDRYPQQVPKAGAQDVWQRSPVSLETCGTPLSWKQKGYTDQQLDYILEQALRWHATSINIKSTAIPEPWKAQFDEFQKKIGYRLILRRLEYPKTAKPGDMMPVSMWWLNKGAAPPYGDYVLALGIGDTVIKTAADVRNWLPGDAVYDSTIYVPDSLKPGNYKFRVALLDPRSGKPAIKLAIQGLQSDGWYDLGILQIQ